MMAGGDPNEGPPVWAPPGCPREPQPLARGDTHREGTPGAALGQGEEAITAPGHLCPSATGETGMQGQLLGRGGA